jgi:RNA-binding protein
MLPFMARPTSTRKASGTAIPGRASEGAANADRASADKASAERAPSPITLATAQKRYLRTLAHNLKPVILVGAKGVTPAMLAELKNALEHHELIKVKIAAGDRDERDAWVAEIVKGAGAALIQRVGNVATMFRPRRKDPGIVLPR